MLLLARGWWPSADSSQQAVLPVTDDRLDADERLPGDLHWHLTHIGGGELSGAMKARTGDLGLDARITWLGAQVWQTIGIVCTQEPFFVAR